LLPPITFDPDAESSEPPIPGSAPPRGPPRNVPGGEDHPNRGVSKLALLRNSNEFIVKLKRRIERRDVAVRKLREEVKRLSALLPEGGEVALDLEEDLDAIEKEAEEERSGKAAARPTERALAAIEQERMKVVVEETASGVDKSISAGT
jgi:hypothetical protein